MRGLEGKTAIVTGGAGGIGSAICRRLAEEGAKVGVLDLRLDAAEKVAAEIGNGASAHACDITSLEGVTAAVQAFEAAQGTTDILVNNAGWDKFAYFLETTPEDWDRIIAINLRGPIHLHHAVLKGMQARRKGRVVNIASDAGRVGSSMEAVYSACKGGIIAFTKTIAREMARANITVNCICPGPTDTPLLAQFLGGGEQGEKAYEGLKRSIPLKRLGRPDDLAGMVAFMASDDAAYITGQVISVSGGLTMSG